MAASDLSKPALTSLSFPDVDVTGGGATVTLSAGATDVGTGVERVYVAFDRAIQGPNGLTYAFLFFASHDSFADGTSSLQQVFDESTASGTYNVTQVVVYDNAGNMTAYTPGELAGMGIDTSFTVASEVAPDLSKPALTSLSFPDVDVTGGGATVTLSAGATDVGTGVERVYVAFDRAIQGPNGLTYAFLFFASHDSFADGTSSLQQVFDESTASGTYNVTQVVVYDNAGNMTAYTPGELAGMGVDTSFTVAAPEPGLVYQVSPDSPAIQAAGGDDTFRLTGLSFGRPDILLAGGAGEDVFDARQVSAGSGYLFFTDASLYDPNGADGTFHVGDYVVSEVETVFGGFGPNWFLLQHMLTPMTIHGGEQGDVFYSAFAHGDVMYGHGGDDRFAVRPGDTAYGGAGADSFELWLYGTGTADGGEGRDRLDLDFGWTVDLAAGHAGGLGGSDHEITAIEDVRVYAWRGYASSVAGDDGANEFSVHADFDDGSVGVDFDGRGGDDLLHGSKGADVLDGGGGNDVVYGGAGNDFLLMQDGGDDTALGGEGNDVLYFGTGLSAGDVADGGPGRDAIVLQGNVTAVLSDTHLVDIESISLQSGANTRFGDTANNFYDFDVTTADGNVAAGQQLIVNASSLRAGEDFTFDGSAETDGKFLVYGGHGVDDLTGGAGVDVFFFEGQRWTPGDRVDGGAGRDALVISGGSGLTHIEFAADSFTNIESISVNNHFATDPSQKPSYELVLHNGNVDPGGTLIVNGSSIPLGQVVGIDGRGVLDGKLTLIGGGGHDTIYSGDGADLIIGGGGADGLVGGAGADIFRFDAASDSAVGLSDLIADFQSGADKIDLGRIDANTLVGGDQAFTFIGASAFSGSAGQLRFADSSIYRFVEGDTNGDGTADFAIAFYQGSAPQVQGDFLL